MLGAKEDPNQAITGGSQNRQEGPGSGATAAGMSPLPLLVCVGVLEHRLGGPCPELHPGAPCGRD